MDAQNEVLETIEQAKEVMTVRRVFGDPYEKNGVTMIPAARVQGGAGGGRGEGPEGEGSGRGSGFGMNAKPAGAFVIKGDQVTWRPAVDPNRMLVVVGFVAVTWLVTRAFAARRRSG